jgi:hypothetical protein
VASGPGAGRNVVGSASTSVMMLPLMLGLAPVGCGRTGGEDRGENKRK